MNLARLSTAALLLGTACLGRTAALAPRQMEHLGRGLVAIQQDTNQVFLSWRLLGADPDDIGFHLYCASGEAAPVRLNSELLRGPTCLVDRKSKPDQPRRYFVRPVLRGREGEPSASFTLAANTPARPYLSVPLQTLPGHTPNDASVGDLDGDGEYEIVLKQEQRGRDNAQRGTTGQTKLEGYRLDGTLLWRIDLGRNIREGAHYTQLMVYDLDGDGRAEIACKTADGTVDGAGTVIGDPNADHRNELGFVLTGPEFLAVFDGATGKALATTNYVPARGQVQAWGDDSGNRVDRFLACIAYLDGERPSLVMCRGYYTRTVLTAWNWRGGRLTQVWTFDSDDGSPGNREYRGQGNHNLSVGDVDGDGRDEIVYGACCIDHDGKGLYTTGLGHGDAMHLSDLDPDHPGLEVFSIHERPRHPHGASMLDARTGAVLWSAASPDVGRGVAFDIDPRYRGYECWAAGPGLDALYSCKGVQISGRKPRSCNFGVWWDGDLLRELLDRTTIRKWDWTDESEKPLLSADGCSANNGSKATPALCADVLGDWREEVIWRTSDSQELRIYATGLPTDHRLPTLMHDPVYRLSVAWQNVAYNQPTQPGFCLGDGLKAAPRPAITTAVRDQPGRWLGNR